MALVTAEFFQVVYKDSFLVSSHGIFVVFMYATAILRVRYEPLRGREAQFYRGTLLSVKLQRLYNKRRQMYDLLWSLAVGVMN